MSSVSAAPRISLSDRVSMYILSHQRITAQRSYLKAAVPSVYYTCSFVC